MSELEAVLCFFVVVLCVSTFVMAVKLYDLGIDFQLFRDVEARPGMRSCDRRQVAVRELAERLTALEGELELKWVKSDKGHYEEIS